MTFTTKKNADYMARRRSIQIQMQERRQTQSRLTVCRSNHEMQKRSYKGVGIVQYRCEICGFTRQLRVEDAPKMATA